MKAMAARQVLNAVLHPGCFSQACKTCVKLRSHRYDSIKLMLAWEHVLPLLPSLLLPAREIVEVLTWTCLINTALGSGILFTYPQIATIAGVQGLVVYALSSSLPLLVFAFLGPVRLFCLVPQRSVDLSADKYRSSDVNARKASF